jgi:hypothetical protein
MGGKEAPWQDAFCYFEKGKIKLHRVKVRVSR